MNHKAVDHRASKRIQLIRNVVNNLNSIKGRGLDSSRNFSQDELIYDATLKKFGRILSTNKYYFIAVFGENQITYFRKQGWKPCKEEFLKDHYRTMTNKDLAKVLQCSEKIVEKKLSKLKLKRNFEWDSEKDEFLIKNLDKTKQWLSARLNTTVSSIKGRIYRLKAKGTLPTVKTKVIHNWIAEDDQFLLENLDKPNQWIADHFKVKVSSIKSRLRKLRESGLISERRKRGKKKNGS